MSFYNRCVHNGKRPGVGVKKNNTTTTLILISWTLSNSNYFLLFCYSVGKLTKAIGRALLHLTPFNTCIVSI